MRICPSCNTNLGEYDYYFCSGCGSVLPLELINYTHEYHRSTKLTPEFSMLRHLSISLKQALKILDPITIIIFTALALSIGLYFSHLYAQVRIR